MSKQGVRSTLRGEIGAGARNSIIAAHEADTTCFPVLAPMLRRFEAVCYADPKVMTAYTSRGVPGQVPVMLLRVIESEDPSMPVEIHGDWKHATGYADGYGDDRLRFTAAELERAQLDPVCHLSDSGT